MNCDRCKGKTCHDCGKCHGCKPACYAHNMWDIQIDPMDPTKLIVVADGVLHKLNMPPLAETVTSLSVSSSASTLNYKGENKTYIITGQQLGNIIELGDLRDVDFDPTFNGTCSELIYRKFNDCGDGCQSPADQWTGFNVNSTDAKKNGIQYVRGANLYGCPQYLNVPTNTSQYWWGMWRPTDSGTGTQFGYIQPKSVTNLPKDSQNRALVLSQESNGRPVIGPLSMNLSLGAVEFTCREAAPGRPSFFQDNSVVTQEFNVTPDDNPNWRAPTDGVMFVSYCVNLYNQSAGGCEVDVTRMLDNETWSSTLEARDSSHSTWELTAGGSVSESCTRFCIVPKGRTIKLYARDNGDTGSGMNTRSGRWRIHAVRAMFLPLTLE